mmetsp:Transcript_2275/g.8091  ORF Transcript_2275/g.8091 Transcript_2275/m.8091 type:complete len:501 (-) Transcript_2275:3027-4529(-)
MKQNRSENAGLKGRGTWRKCSPQKRTFLQLAKIFCSFLLVGVSFILTRYVKSNSSKQVKKGALKNVFLREKQFHFTQTGRRVCNHHVFNSYLSIHKLEMKKDVGRYLIYHILEDDVVGLGCRMTGALYALALSMSTDRALILSGVEFQYLYSERLNFERESLVQRAHKVLHNAQVGEILMRNNTSYMKIEITLGNYMNASKYFEYDSLSHVSILYVNSISSHRHVDRLMAEDVKFRERIITTLGEKGKAFLKENHDLMSKHRYKLVPEYPTVWRQLWGCAQWFLFDKLHFDLEEVLDKALSGTKDKPCEKLIAIHFRGGDTSFASNLSRRRRSKDPQTEIMIDRWMKRLRTPIEALDIFLSYAKGLSQEYHDVKVCYFIASDERNAYNYTKAKTGSFDILQTPGVPQHSSLSKTSTATIKALADYVLLGMSDALVHGMSTFSESAIERSFGKNIEVKCRSPQKKLWSNAMSWYCIQKGKKIDENAKKTLSYLKSRFSGIL